LVYAIQQVRIISKLLQLDPTLSREKHQNNKTVDETGLLYNKLKRFPDYILSSVFCGHVIIAIYLFTDISYVVSYQIGYCG
jgi:hypothetical protein